MKWRSVGTQPHGVRTQFIMLTARVVLSKLSDLPIRRFVESLRIFIGATIRVSVFRLEIPTF